MLSFPLLSSPLLLHIHPHRERLSFLPLIFFLAFISLLLLLVFFWGGGEGEDGGVFSLSSLSYFSLMFNIKLTPTYGLEGERVVGGFLTIYLNEK